MKKKRGSWSLVTVRARQESAKKAQRQVQLILSLVYVLVLGGASASLAKTTTCGDPDSCVITVFAYCTYPYTTTVSNTSTTWPNVDTTCSQIVTAQKEPSVVGPTTIYEGTLAKLFFDGTRWATISAVGVSVFGADGLALSSSVTHPFLFYPDASGCNAVYVFVASGHLYDYLPANCSNLPPPQQPAPVNTPNLDLGKPDCPQVPLNQ